MLDLLNVLNDVMRNDPWLSPLSAPAGVAPSSLWVDVAEDDAGYLILAELPGVSLDDVKLEIEDDVLTLSAVKRPPQGDERRGVHYRERRYGTFERAFALPKAIHRDAVQATMKDGVLSIHLPKAEQARPRQIPVRLGALSQGEGPARQITAEGTESGAGAA